MMAFDQVSLRTARLRLRPYVPSDAKALLGIYCDPQVCRYLPRGAWQDIAPAHERIARDGIAMAASSYMRLAIVRSEDDALIGDCCLFNLNEQCRRLEIGYALRRDTWGNGYVNEALRALVGLAFTQLDQRRIEADIDPRNAASARSLERLGFVKEGHLRERWVVDGEVSDTALYGLLRSEWAAAAPARSDEVSARQPAG